VSALSFYESTSLSLKRSSSVAAPTVSHEFSRSGTHSDFLAYLVPPPSRFAEGRGARDPLYSSIGLLAHRGTVLPGSLRLAAL
jgi:hypothetical protein